MPRKKNTKLKAEILAAAWESFKLQGYEATTYSTVAKAVGIQRALVQYHFPKKEKMAEQFFVQKLKAAQKALGYSKEDLTNNFEKVFAVATCFYTYLLQENSYQRFLFEVLDSRALTRELVPFNGSYVFRYISSLSQIKSGKALDADMRDTFAIFYERLYDSLLDETEFHVAEELAPVLSAMAGRMGYPLTQINALKTPSSCFSLQEVVEAAHSID